jgi:hypothetical protein
MKAANVNTLPRYQASGIERLRRLADFVETLPREKLTFGCWFGFGKGCAVGWAAQDPWFQAQGLKLEEDARLAACRPAYAGRTDWAAVTRFFEIDMATARTLFDAFGYGREAVPAPRDMAERIRRHIQKHVADAAL